MSRKLSLVVDDKEYTGEFYVDSSGEYIKLTPSLERDRAAPDDNSYDVRLDQRMRKLSERNMQFAQILAGATNLDLLIDSSRKTLGRFYIKGAGDALSIFKRCLHSGGKL